MTTVTFARRKLAQLPARAQLAGLGRGEFEGYASLFGVADSAGDVVARGAFAKSLKARPPAAVRMLYQHMSHEPIGVWQVIREDAAGLYVRGKLTLDVQRARDVMSLMQDGALDGLSIGFRTRKAHREAGHRILTEVELWEISIVTFPLLKQSLVASVGAKSALALTISNAARKIANSE